MPFDKEQVEQAVVDVLPGGMGVLLIDDYIVTACHCLPRRNNEVVLPNPDLMGDDPLLVRVRHRGTGQEAPVFVIAAEPCSDLAILAGSTLLGMDLLPQWQEQLDSLWSSCSEFPLLELEPPPSETVYIYTHEDKWIEGRRMRETISFDDPSARIRSGTSGAPVFSEKGRVVGIVSWSAEKGRSDARMCLLASHLPGWALKRARDAQ